ncbi:MAG: type I restriction endonuclease subunit R, partial [Rhodothermaceae bacterium]|nr:type I restriction endonuclease subunit R [Rhodothermaceae bacterium]
MSTKTTDWDELHLAENPAVDLLESLGYTYIPPEELEKERESFKETVLPERLAAALQHLNPWLDETNVTKATKAVTHVPDASLAEANETLYTSLTYGIALEQDRGDGRKSHTVRFLDFDHPDRNELIVTRQYKVLGSKKHIIPDVVAFVNGLPLAVIECKNPTIGDAWKAEAVKQLHRYQEAGSKWKGQGAPRLFEAAQILVGTCGERAVYGTVGTPARFFLEWKEPYPLTVRHLGERLGRAPTPQDILLYGLLEPHNLLDVVRNFVVFEVEGGQAVRKMTRYRQFIAVNKAMRRIRTARKPSERGGIVWHTQGSGKSLTMLWLALKLRRDEAQQQPTVVIVTDRTKLDRQIAGVFTACGFPNPERADSVRALRRILEHPTGKTVMTTIQKFQEITAAGGAGRRGAVHPTLSEAANIFVMVDEAHRTQYRSLAANMRQALPNACFLGFTGTPIDKKDRSTLRTFGPYIDTYTIEQAVHDKATVPIFYESRLPELQIIGTTIDQVFDHVFDDRSKDERAAIKQRFATEQAIAGAPRRIEVICLDLIDHFKNYIAPNRFKAQLVATSRHTAVTYKEALDRLNGPESALIMSADHNDEERLARWHLRKDEQDQAIERFKDQNDPLSILVVCDMLLTGFDARVEQVMYLDAPLKEHTLLQAIARVNRPFGEEKTYGLVVDYWGVSAKLQEALAIFSTTDVQGALTPNVDELPRLQSRHAAAMKFFQNVEAPDDLDTCVRVLEPSDVRAGFDLAFRRFSQSMDMLLPDQRALAYKA